MIRKIVSIATMLCLLLSLSVVLPGCSYESRTQYDTVTLSWGCIGDRDGVDTWIASEVAARVYSRTDAHVQIIYYDNGQLGDSEQLYQQIQTGNVDMGLITVYEDINPKAGVVFLPMLATGYDQFREIYKKDGPLWDYVAASHAELDMTMLGMWPDGFVGVGLTASKSSPESYFDPTTRDNEVIRVPALRLTKVAMEEMGFETVEIAYTDIYRCLRDGECDGVFSSGAYDNYMLYRDLLEYFIDYRMTADVYTLLINTAKYETIDPKYREIMEETIDEVLEEGLQRIESKEAKALKDMESEGITVYTPTDKQREYMRDYYRINVWPDFRNDYGSIIDELTEEAEDADEAEETEGSK